MLHQRQRVGKRRVRADGDGVDHHAGLELFHLPHLLGLRFRIEDCGGSHRCRRPAPWRWQAALRSPCPWPRMMGMLSDSVRVSRVATSPRRARPGCGPAKAAHHRRLKRCRHAAAQRGAPCVCSVRFCSVKPGETCESRAGDDPYHAMVRGQAGRWFAPHVFSDTKPEMGNRPRPTHDRYSRRSASCGPRFHGGDPFQRAGQVRVNCPQTEFSFGEHSNATGQAQYGLCLNPLAST
jgi:hypothetical protein